MFWVESDRRALEAALALYRASFEKSSIPEARVRALLEDGTYRLALDGAGADVRAMALVARFPAERFAHLDYIATAAPERRRGAASRLVRFLVEDARREGLAALTLETEDAMSSFYGKRGALLLAGLPYVFPSPTHGPLPMQVMAFALDGLPTIDRARVTELVRAIYRVIHARSEPDPILDSILSRIPARIALEAITLDAIALDATTLDPRARR